MDEETRGRPPKIPRALVKARLHEATLREISVDTEGSGVDRSDVLGEMIELVWASAANKKRREAAREYLSKKP